MEMKTKNNERLNNRHRRQKKKLETKQTGIIGILKEANQWYTKEHGEEVRAWGECL